jgi:hypothetical protein
VGRVVGVLTRQVSLIAVANYRVEPQPKQRRQIEETGTSMAISTSNWNGKGARANPHTRKIAPATITAMRIISSFVLSAIAKVPNPMATKTKPAIYIFIIQLVGLNIAHLLLVACVQNKILTIQALRAEANFSLLP